MSDSQNSEKPKPIVITTSDGRDMTVGAYLTDPLARSPPHR